MRKNIMLICYQTEKLEKLQSALEQSQITVTQIDKMQNAITSMLQYNPAFILLDFDIEDAARLLREVSSSIIFDLPPYILIAASFSEGPDRATIYNLRADACIEKPIDPQEVVALIQAVVRRERKVSQLKMEPFHSSIVHKDLVIELTRHTVTMKGKPIALTRKEFELLKLLAQNAGTVLTKETIYETIWKADYQFSSTSVTDHIHSLRQKLGLSKKMMTISKQYMVSGIVWPTLKIFEQILSVKQQRVSQTSILGEFCRTKPELHQNLDTIRSYFCSIVLPKVSHKFNWAACDFGEIPLTIFVQIIIRGREQAALKLPFISSPIQRSK